MESISCIVYQQLKIPTGHNLTLPRIRREEAICGGDKKTDGEKMALIREDETRPSGKGNGGGEPILLLSKLKRGLRSLFSSSSSTDAAPPPPKSVGAKPRVKLTSILGYLTSYI